MEDEELQKAADTSDMTADDCASKDSGSAIRVLNLHQLMPQLSLIRTGKSRTPA